jgi:pimeloyl-ACP methyl ester carboxylesterase
VVLIQGLGLSGRFWFVLPEELAASGYRVLVPDNRGTGKSELPRRPFRMSAMADDVAAVLDAEGIERTVVAGISMGGMIAQHVAIRHAPRVEGLVLMATTCGLPHGKLPGPRAIKTLLSLPFARGREASRLMAELLLPAHEIRNAREHLADWPAAMREEPPRPQSFFMQLGAVLTHSTGGRLSEITCPTIVMTGEHDILVPPDNSAIIASLIPRATLERLPECAHAIPALDRKCLSRAIQHVRRVAG